MTKLKYLIQKYKKTIIGAHFVIFTLFVINLISIGKESGMFMTSNNSEIYVGQTINIDVMVKTQIPINAVGADIIFPEDKFDLIEISKEGSFLDLWPEDPILKKGSGILHFSGGTFQKGGFYGEGKILSIKAKALSSGSAKLTFASTEILAADGKGTNIINKTGDIEYIIHKEPNAEINKKSEGSESDGQVRVQRSIDLNGDKRVNLMDFSIMSIAIFSSYDQKYDLNYDEKVNFSDLSIIISHVF